MESNVRVYEKAPEGFLPAVEAVACYIESEGKLLLVCSSSLKEETGKWGVPGGKLEKGETPLIGAQRELLEETGISLSADELTYSGPLFIEKPHVSYVFHVFRASLTFIPSAITISDEHSDFIWADTELLEKLPLMDGADAALSLYRKAISVKP